jgi:tripartite-type tricarboxylate transporter receptor subunit TctC
MAGIELAVTGAEQLSSALVLPTMAEARLAGFDVASWFGLFVPAKTPRDIIAKMHADTVTVLKEPNVKMKLEQLGATVVGSPPEALARHLQAQIDKWGPVIAGAKIQING